MKKTFNTEVTYTEASQEASRLLVLRLRQANTNGSGFEGLNYTHSDDSDIVSQLASRPISPEDRRIIAEARIRRFDPENNSGSLTNSNISTGTEGIMI